MWKSANTPLPTQNNPRVIFERLFGDAGTTDPKVRVARMRQQKSVLDSVTEEVAHLQGALPAADRVKLTEYLSAIRDVEQRIQLAEAQADQELPLVDHPAGIPADWEAHMKLMLDLQVLAYQCDLTRVITFMVGPRAQRHDLSADWRGRFASPDFALRRRGRRRSRRSRRSTRTT